MGKKGGNAWNDFQRAHGGEGLTRGDMASLYHAANAPSSHGGGGGYAAPAAKAPSQWNTFQHEHGGRGLTRTEAAALYAQQKEAARVERKKEPRENPWNDFQKAHAGNGLTREEAAFMYKARDQPFGYIESDAHYNKPTMKVEKKQPSGFSTFQYPEGKVKRDPAAYQSPPPPPTGYTFGNPAALGVQNPVSFGFAAAPPEVTPAPKQPEKAGFTYGYGAAGGFTFGKYNVHGDPSTKPTSAAPVSLFGTPTITSTPTTGFTFGGRPASPFFGDQFTSTPTAGLAFDDNRPASPFSDHQFTFGGRPASPFSGYRFGGAATPEPTQPGELKNKPVFERLEPDAEHVHHDAPLDPLVLKRLTDRDGNDVSPEELMEGYYVLQKAKRVANRFKKNRTVTFALLEEAGEKPEKASRHSRADSKSRPMKNDRPDPPSGDGSRRSRPPPPKEEAEPPVAQGRSKSATVNPPARVDKDPLPAERPQPSHASVDVEQATTESNEEAHEQVEKPNPPQSEGNTEPATTDNLIREVVADQPEDAESKPVAAPAPSDDGCSETTAESATDLLNDGKGHGSSAAISLTGLEVAIAASTILATGRHCSVYTATVGSPATSVAVTVFPNAQSPVALTRVQDEVAQFQKLPEHPHLVRCLGLFQLQDSATSGLVAERVNDHVSLSSRVYDPTRPEIPESTKHDLLLQILGALEALHANGLSHRDVSPHHVLVNDSLSSIKLVGFGVPTLRNTAARQAGRTGFSEEYASPELLKGELGVQDTFEWKASDVFSFTVLLVELLTQQKPWEGELAVYITAAVGNRNQRPTDPSAVQVRGERSSALEAVVRQGWDHDPGARPTAKVLRERLTEIFAEKKSEVCIVA